MTKDGKARILGRPAVGDFTKDRVQKELDNGHPLFWCEWKPVKLYSTMYRDFEIGSIVDLTPGSGAACLAALYSGIPYTGLCVNEPHQSWLAGLFQKAYVALVATQAVSVDKELIANVKQYLERTAEAAKQLLPRDSAAPMECPTGADDSDDET